MQQVASEMLSRLREALPEANVYWEKEPAGRFKGSVLSAEMKKRKFTVRFDSRSEAAEEFDSVLVDQVVDDFVEFFETPLCTREERFTRMV